MSATSQSARADARAARMAAMVARAERSDAPLRRTLGTFSLGALGIAMIVGAGIFVLAGDAAGQYAGPSVTIAFAIAGIAAGLSALCYAELASILPVSGSTYSYAAAVLGTFVGWVIGWDLLLEYLVGGAAVASGWSGYVANVLGSVGINLPAGILDGPFDGGVVNLPAVVIVLVATMLLVSGVRESAGATNVLVALKVGALLLFAGVGAFYISGANLTPFVPPNEGAFGEFGWTGVLRAASVVFFAYIGFDAVCTAAQEAREPRRAVPRAVLGSLLAATLLYIAVGLVMTGLAPYPELVAPDALSVALEHVGSLGWLARLLDVVATVALGATVLATLYGQSRILMRMAEDGLLPSALARVDTRTGTPRTGTLLCGLAAALVAGLVPLQTLSELISVGTLFAFVIVSCAVLVLRRSAPDLPRGFRVPGGPVIPLLAIVVDVALVALIPVASIVRLVIWFLIGIAVYLAYGRKRATL
jgi:APA family basic amino acid/polyamine antiporter